MMGSKLIALVCLIGCTIAPFVVQIALAQDSAHSGSDSSHSWLVTNPPQFQNRSEHLGDGLLDVRNDPVALKVFVDLVDTFLPRVDGYTDGEVIDAIEHYFWGQRNGLAIELGALDGTPGTKSQTYEYQRLLGWNRILVEGDPGFRNKLKRYSPNTFNVNAPICSHRQSVHYSDQMYTGGILEFMQLDFMKNYHPKIYELTNPPGNLSSVDWSKVPHVQSVECIPLSLVLTKARVRHVNFFILDVEGGEIEVLKSINWALVKFDVLCIETSPKERPVGYPELVTKFLEEKGYINYSGQIGRNTWYTHVDFKPMARPGIASDCYNGFRKADRQDKWWYNRKTPPFTPCPMH